MPVFAFVLLCAAFLLPIPFVAAKSWAGAVVSGTWLLSYAIAAGWDYLRPVRIRITEDGVRISRPKIFVPFKELLDVVPGGKAGQHPRPIHLILPRETIRISERADFDTDALLDGIRTRISPARDQPVTPALFEPFLRQQALLHSPENIHVFRGMFRPIRRQVLRPFLKFAVASLAPIPLWLGLMAAWPRIEAFPIASCIAFGFASLTLILMPLAYLSKPRGVGRPGESALIVTPDGLALSQGDLRGELRWSEVEAISTNLNRSFAITRHHEGLYLQVKGAHIYIADIYNWPIAAIIPLVEAYSGSSVK